MSHDEVQTGISVLLVDDQRFIGAALGQLLAGEDGITLHYCQHATEAMARASEIRPSVILQDLVLPDIDGLTMVELFHADPATANTPVIVLSASDDIETRTRATAAGACDYLVKLPKREELVACIRRHAAPAGSAHTLTTRTTIVQETLSLGVLDDLRTEDGELPEFAVTLMDAFADEVNSQVAVLRSARTGCDAGLLKATLHSLKGTSLTMGAMPLAGLCAGMEQEVATGSIDDLSPQLMTDIESEVIRVLSALATHRDRVTFAQAS